VLEAARELTDRLKKNWRVKLDDSDNSAGWKFAEYEMKGVPLRLELGPRDIQEGQCVVVRRDNRQKYFVKLDELETELPRIMEEYRQAIYQIAFDNRAAKTFTATNMEELANHADDGYIKAMWCGQLECEMAIKDQLGVTSRCIPFEQEKIGETCVCCQQPAKEMVVWGKAY
jgi:prolyl-tRNA synthetase